MSDEQTLRDTFAAAALTGLLAGRQGRIDGLKESEAAQTAGAYADAMLRERARTNSADISTTLRNGAPDAREAVTDHDAAPAAIAAELARSPGQSPRGTGETTPPTITDAEREAVWSAIEYGEDTAVSGLPPLWAAALRRLLARLGGGR